LTRPNLGEGDLAVVFAGNFVRQEIGVQSVCIETIDSDVIGISMLHSFLGLYVHTRYKNTHHVFDIQALVEAIPKTIGYEAATFVRLAISRGTDFHGPCIKGIGDWNDYMHSARGCGSRDLRQMLLTILNKTARKKAVMHPEADLKRADWVFEYWQKAPSVSINTI
jgi:hypothetical protein